MKKTARDVIAREYIIDLINVLTDKRPIDLDALIRLKKRVIDDTHSPRPDKVDKEDKDE